MATLRSIQQLLDEDDCKKILKRSLNQHAEIFTYEICKFHNDVAGFLADHLQLRIQFTMKNVPSKMTFFIKALPQSNQNQLDYVEESGIFKKEVLLYRNLLSELLKINHFGPVCYFIKDNFIVLEDLRAKGFRMLPKDDYLSDEHCAALMKTLGQFHASTFIYEDKWGVKLDEKFQNELKETCFSFVEGQPRQKWCVTVTKCVGDLIKLLPPSYNHQQVCDKLHKFVFEELPKLLQPSTRFRNVLTHDDLWCNNMLFNENNECVFVDFQLARYTPPGFDLFVTLLMNLKPSYLEENFERVVDIYYSSMKHELKKHHLDVDVILPKSELMESLEFYKLAALTEAAMYGTHIYISKELSNSIVENIHNYNEFSFINRSKFVVEEFQKNARYRHRLGNILIPLIGVLSKN